MNRSFVILLAIYAVFILACGSVHLPPTGIEAADLVVIDGVSLDCDPDRSLFDDHFVVQVRTRGPVDRVSVEVLMDSVLAQALTGNLVQKELVGEYQLSSTGPGAWQAVIPADEVSGDCSEMGHHRFDVKARGARATAEPWTVSY